MILEHVGLATEAQRRPAAVGRVYGRTLSAPAARLAVS
jgi:hypothetical protein